MNASLDTDIVIHLYSCGQKDLLFKYFNPLYMHAFLFEKELKRISPPVYNDFTADIKIGRIEIVENKDLIEIGIFGLFESYKRDYEYLFDNGELHGVCLAKSMGLFAFLTDDTKEFGPHETLVKELIEEVMPFSFYELLFLEFLTEDLTAQQLHQAFTCVNSCSMNKNPMGFRKKMLITARRFSSKHGTKRDNDWILQHCHDHKINHQKKITELMNYLRHVYK